MTKKEWFKNFIVNEASDTTLAMIWSLCLRYMPKENDEISNSEKEYIEELRLDMQKEYELKT